MKINEIRALSHEELTENLEGLRKQYMELQFKRRSGVEKPHTFREIRRTMARIHTVLKEKKR